ncbi:CHAT domain-containing protein [Flammeovirga pacifica]|uniref:CHAT domain-containing protein n=1 Tax=Flammeovirga pacifica TaxID=915059 RepID=A0A1S1YZ23_FLAPC|nr:CHAT domain-containing protein [Flammeovirga pacifica]OHX66259.1 hypothetical protein NH26_07785 [Flammeovirga pacifica]
MTIHSRKLIFLLILIFNIQYSQLFAQKNQGITPQSINNLFDEGKMSEAKDLSKQWINQSKVKFGNQSIEVVIPLLVSSELSINRNEYKTAIKKIDEAITIMDKSSGWLYPDYALALNYKAFCLLQLNQTFQAIPLVDEAETIYRKTLSSEHPDNVYTAINRAVIYRNFKEYDKSEEYFIKSREFNFKHEKEKVGLENTIDDDWIQIQMAKLYIKSYRTDINLVKTLNDLERYYHKNKKTNTSQYLLLLSTIGDAYELQSNNSKAKEYYKRGLEKHIKNYGSNHISTLITLFQLAKLNKKESNYLEATAQFQQIINKFDQIEGDPVMLKEAYYHLSDISLKQGNTKAASNYLAKGEEIETYDPELHLFSLKLQGTYHFINGEYVEAELRLTELLSFVRQEKIFFTIHYSETVALLAEMFITLGRINEAKNICENEIRFLEKRAKENSYAYFLVSAALYEIYLDEGKTKDLKEKVDTLEVNIKKVLTEDHALLIETQFILANLAFRNGDIEKANMYHVNAQSIAKSKKISDKHYLILKIIDQKASIYLSLNEYENAYNELKKLENTFDNNSIHKPTIKGKMAYINSLLGKWDAAERMILNAVDLKFKQLNEQLTFTSEDEKVNFIHNTSLAFTYFFSMMATDEGIKSPLMRSKCYDIQVNYRKFFLKESILRKHNINKLSQYRQSVKFTNYTKSLNQLKSKLATANFLSPTERKEINFNAYEVTDQINNLEKSLVYATYSNTDSTLLDMQYTWKSTQTRLKEGEIAVEIIKLKNILETKVSYGAIIISKELERPKFVPIGNAKILEQDILREYQSITQFKTRSLIVTKKPKKKYYAYDFYWKPIRETINTLGIKSNKIFLSNDGIYNSINLNILTNPKTQKYVIEEENIHLVMSTADIYLYRQKPLLNKEILLVGNPVFQKEETSLSRDVEEDKARGNEQAYYFNLYNLPGTETEIKTTAQLFEAHNWKVTSWSQLDATEENIKKIETSPYILHLATHGFYLDALRYPIINSPLLKSGLFFSEITFKENKKLKDIYNSGNDGILTAYEVKGLNLNNTELLVLSACQSGVSELTSGDGISGLQYAFSIAGVNSIIMSLWSVDDIATQMLMNEFYKQWIAVGDKTIAFKNAQEELIKTYPHPYYWGAFVMVN